MQSAQKCFHQNSEGRKHSALMGVSSAAFETGACESLRAPPGAPSAPWEPARPPPPPPPGNRGSPCRPEQAGAGGSALSPWAFQRGLLPWGLALDLTCTRVLFGLPSAKIFCNRHRFLEIGKFHLKNPDFELLEDVKRLGDATRSPPLWW